jgi:glutamate racemase
LDSRPIGVFDSGIGGTSVLKQLLKLMPNEDYIYLGDTLNVPYGTKSKGEIVDYSLKCAEFLSSKNVKQIVVACNTASNTAKIELLSKYPNIQLVDLVKPLVNMVLESSINHTIGVIATEATLRNIDFKKKIEDSAIAKQITIVKKAGPKFVSLVEDNELDSPKAKDIIQEYMSPMLEENMDVLVLGCTHYQFLKEQIAEFAPNVRIIDPSELTAHETMEKLQLGDRLSDNNFEGNIEFYVTKESKEFNVLASSLLGFECPTPQLVSI